MALSQYEFDRLMLTLENSRSNWQAAPNKRVLQLAFEYIDACRRAGSAIADYNTGRNYSVRWLTLYPHSAKARSMVCAVLTRGVQFSEHLDVLTRVANMNGEHA